MNILRIFVENFISLFRPGQKQSKPTKQVFRPELNKFPSNKIKGFKKSQNLHVHFKKPHFPPTRKNLILPIGKLSQEFLLAHLVLVSIPLLFTGIYLWTKINILAVSQHFPNQKNHITAIS